MRGHVMAGPHHRWKPNRGVSRSREQGREDAIKKRQICPQASCQRRRSQRSLDTARN